MQTPAPSWIQRLQHGVRAQTPTLVDLVDLPNRWLAVAGVLEAASTTWLIVPDRELEGTLRALAEHLPDVRVSSLGEPVEDGPVALVRESYFFEQVSVRWVTGQAETLPAALVFLFGDGLVERCRDALTRTVRDRWLLWEAGRRVRLGRLVGSTAVLPADLCRELSARQSIPLVNDSPNWVAYLEQVLGGPVLRSRPVEVAPMLEESFRRAVVVLGEALAVGSSMAFAADELGLQDPLELTDGEARWDDLTLFTPPMPETSTSGWPYAVADAAWRAIQSREGRSLVYGSTMNRFAIQQRIRRPLRVMGERGSGVVFAGPNDLDRVGTYPLVVVDRLPFPDTLLPVESVQRSRRLRWFEEVGLPKAVQRFRRLARCVEPGGALVVLDARIHNRVFGEAFTDALHCVHLWDWEGFLPASASFVGGVQ